MSCSRARVVFSGLAAFILACALHGGEAEADASFLLGESGECLTWLMAGPVDGELAPLESLKAQAAPISENDPVPGAKGERWLYLNAGGGAAVDLTPFLKAAHRSEGIFYLVSRLTVEEETAVTGLLRGFGPGKVWIDDEHVCDIIVDPRYGIASGRLETTLAPGTHRLRVRIAANGGYAGFNLALVEPRNAARTIRQTLRLVDFDEKRRAQAWADAVRLQPSPRFLPDGETAIRFHLSLGGGAPVPAQELRLRVAATDESGKEWMGGEGELRPPEEAAAFGLWAKATGPAKATWDHLAAKGTLLAGDAVLATAETSVFREAGLIATAESLGKDIPGAEETYGAPLPLARLKNEQIGLLLARPRQRRTRAYGDKLLGLTRELARCLHEAKEGRDPQAIRLGVLEGAYISDADGSTQPYRFYIPRSYLEFHRNGIGLPLIVMLHGYVPSYNKLDWMDIDPAMAQAMDQMNAALLLPFGRSNTDFLSIGEVDVLRAIEEIRKRYTIDPKRISLAGFSMGGSGAWTLLSHYPDRFAAARIWSGRTDYYHWHENEMASLGLSWDVLPRFKRVLIDTDNPLTLVETLQDIPIRASHPLNDRLVKPGHTLRMEERLKPPKGKLEATFPETPPLGHFQFRQELSQESSYDWMLNHKRTPPERVEHVTYTPKYGRKFWLRTDRLGTWGQRARLAARIDREKERILVEAAENVATFSILPKRLPGNGLHLTDGWEIILPDGAEPRAFRKEALQESPDDPDGPAFVFHLTNEENGPLAKTASLCGPVKEAFNSAFVLVPGTSGSDAEDAALRRKAERFADEWERFARGRPAIVDDASVTDETMARKNLICFGSPATHGVLKKLAGRMPIRWLESGYAVGDVEVAGDLLGLVAVYPNPEAPGRYVVVMDGLYYGESLPINHKWDLVPDWIIFDDRRVVYDGTNKPLAAGFFDASWRFDPALAEVFRK